MLLTSSSDSDALLWDLSAGAEIDFLSTRETNTDILCGDLTGEQVALGYYNDDLRVFGYDGEGQLSLTGHTARVVDVHFSPDGTQLASISYDGTVRVWDVATGEEIAQTTGFMPQIYDLAVSGDGSTIAWIGFQGGFTAVLAVGEDEPQVFIDPDPCCGIGFDAVALAPDGSMAYVMTNDQKHYVRVIDVVAGETTEIERDVFQPVDGVVLTLDVNGEKLALASGRGTIVLVDRNTWEEIARTQVGNLRDVTFSVDGELLVAAETQSKVHVLNTTDLSQASQFGPSSGNSLNIWATALSPDNEVLAISDSRADYYFFQGGQTKTLPDLYNIGSMAIAYSPDGRFLVLGHRDGRITLLSASNKTILEVVDHAHQADVETVAFLPDGTLISAGIDGVVKLWEINATP